MKVAESDSVVHIVPTALKVTVNLADNITCDGDLESCKLDNITCNKNMDPIQHDPLEVTFNSNQS